MSGGDGTSIPKVSEENVNSPKYVLKSHNLYVLLIHDERRKVKDLEYDGEDMESKSQSRIDNDLEQLKNILQKFQPKLREICINDQITIDGFKEELKKVAGDIDTNVGAFLCVFIGFGGSQYVYLGREEKGPIQKIDFADVVEHFNGENCRDLVMKPKMFFVQAETTHPPPPSTGKFSGGEEQIRFIRIPIQADIFVYFSSALAGKVWNEVQVSDTDDQNVMSRFVKLLCSELQQLNRSIEIQRMVINMNFQIHEAEFKDDKKPQNGVDFLPLSTSQLTKDLFLADIMEK